MSQSTPYEDLATQDAVEAVMSGEAGPAVIDFWAPWCGPCRAMAPAFENVAARFDPGQVRFYKLNTEEHPDLAAPFHVRSIPTVMFVSGGEILDVSVGVLDASRLTKKVQWLVSKASGESFLSRLFGVRRS